MVLLQGVFKVMEVVLGRKNIWNMFAFLKSDFMLYSLVWFLGLNVQVYVRNVNLRITAFYVVLLFVFTSGWVIYKNIKKWDVLLFIAYLLCSSLISMLVFGKQPSYFVELAKIVIIFGGGVLFSRAISHEKLLKLLAPFPYVVTLTIFLQFVMGEADFDILNYARLGFINTLGEPNTIGFFLASAILFLLCDDRASGMLRKIQWLFILTDILLLSMTFSRSAILGVVLALIGVAVFTARNKGKKGFQGLIITLFLIAGLVPSYYFMKNFVALKNSYHSMKMVDSTNNNEPVVYPHKSDVVFDDSADHRSFMLALNFQRFNLNKSLSQLSNGRLKLWENIIRDSFNSPLRVFIGVGPGLIKDAKLAEVDNTTDSLLIMAYYSFGIIGVGILAFFFIRLVRQYLFDEHTRSDIQLAIFVLLSVTWLVNNSTSAQQLLFLGALLVALVFSKPQASAGNQLNN